MDQDADFDPAILGRAWQPVRTKLGHLLISKIGLGRTAAEAILLLVNRPVKLVFEYESEIELGRSDYCRSSTGGHRSRTSTGAKCCADPELSLSTLQLQLSNWTSQLMTRRELN